VGGLCFQVGLAITFINRNAIAIYHRALIRNNLCIKSPESSLQKRQTLNGVSIEGEGEGVLSNVNFIASFEI